MSDDGCIIATNHCLCTRTIRANKRGVRLNENHCLTVRTKTNGQDNERIMHAPTCTCAHIIKMHVSGTLLIVCDSLQMHYSQIVPN